MDHRTPARPPQVADSVSVPMFLRIGVVMRLTGLSRSTIYRHGGPTFVSSTRAAVPPAHRVASSGLGSVERRKAERHALTLLSSMSRHNRPRPKAAELRHHPLQHEPGEKECRDDAAHRQVMNRYRLFRQQLGALA